MTPAAGHAPSIPEVHFDDLARTELTHFWHLSRVTWVSHILLKAAGEPANLRVVDIGCGTGGLLHLLDSRFRFKRAAGVDPSPAAIQRAGRLGANYFCVDPESYAPPADTDVILLMDVLEHVEDDGGLLARLLAPLRPGALAVVSVPALTALYSSWDRHLGHYRRYDRRTLTAAVQRGGGEVAWIGYGFSYLLPAALLRRYRDAAKPIEEFPRLPRWVTSLLLAVNRAEIALSTLLPIPAGTSLFCLVRRK